MQILPNEETPVEPRGLRKRRLDDELWAITLGLDADSIAGDTARLLTSRLGYHASWFARGFGDGAKITHYSGTTPLLEGVVMRSGLGIGGKALAVGDIVIVDDYLSSESITHHYDKEITRERIRSIVAAPIFVAGQATNVLLAGFRDDRGLGGRATSIFNAVACHTGRALDTAAKVRSYVDVATRKERHRVSEHFVGEIDRTLTDIRQSMQGCRDERTLIPSIQEKLAVLIAGSRATDEDSYQNCALTARERTVLYAMARGDGNKEIAESLSIGVATVKTYVSRILSKLDARNRARAIAIARARNLVS